MTERRQAWIEIGCFAAAMVLLVVVVWRSVGNGAELEIREAEHHRMEAKIDRLLEANGIDPEQFHR